MTRRGVLLAGLACASLAGCGSSARSTATGSLANLSTKLRAPRQLQGGLPDFELHDSHGRIVRLSQFRGKAVLLTFIYTRCPDVCPLIVADLHTAVQRLGAAAGRLQIVAVSVDPRGDTPRAVNAFLAAHRMTGRIEYLVGSTGQLAPVWRAYGVEVQATPAQREVGHSAFVYGITGRGVTVALYPPEFEPAWIVHDVPILAAS